MTVCELGWTFYPCKSPFLVPPWHLPRNPHPAPRTQGRECDYWQLLPDKIYSSLISTFTILFIKNQMDLRAVSFFPIL